MQRIDSEHLHWVFNADVGPQVVPQFGALAEIWSEAAEFVEPTSEVVYEVVLSEVRAVSPADVAAALESLYQDRIGLRRVAAACHQRVTRPEFQWESIGLRWNQMFAEVCSDLPKKAG